MNEQAKYMKVAKGLLFVQGKWTITFLAIVLFITILKIIFGAIRGNEVDGFFETAFVASNIYMFITGIIAVSFLAYFVENGVTRKDYFLGAIIAAIILSIFLPIIAVIINLIEKFVFTLFHIPYKVTNLDDIEFDGDIISDFVQSLIVSPYVNPDSNVFLACFILFINLFVAYLLGWFIRAGYYRFGSMIGFLFIVIAVCLKLLKDTLIRVQLDQQIVSWFLNFTTLPLSMTIIGVVAIIAFMIFMIRMATKRVTVKF